MGFLGGSVGKEPTCNAGDLGLIPELGRSLGEGNGYPLQYSGLENPRDCIVFHGMDTAHLTIYLLNFLKGNGVEQMLPIINKTVMNINVKVFVLTSNFSSLWNKLVVV